MRQTPFQNVGQQSFFDPLMNNMASAPSSMGQFMQDYEGMARLGETGPKRPRSRELDMMNLLLIGSMNKGKQRSGLEGLDQFLGPPQISAPQSGNSLSNFGQQLLGEPNIQAPQTGRDFSHYPQFDQHNYPNQQQYSTQPMQYTTQSMTQYPQSMTPQYMQQVPQQMMPQLAPSDLYSNRQLNQQQTPIHPLLQPQFNPQLSISPPNQVRQQEKLYVNGQMGVNLNQVSQQPQELLEKPNTRVIEYIMRQNEALERLTKNMASTREKEMKEEQQRLLQRMKQLEAQNAQDAFYNDMYDEVPPHLRQQQYFRPPPMWQQHPNLYQQQFVSAPYPQPKRKQQTLQMLRLLKQMVFDLLIKQLNKRPKNKKKLMQEIINDEGEMDSYTSEESDPEPQIVQKPRILKPRPIPPPPKYDPLDDQQKLEKLKRYTYIQLRQRGMRNFRIFFHRYSFVIWWYKYMKKIIFDKKEKAKKEVPEMQQKFVDDSHGLYTRILKIPIDSLVNSKTNIQIVPNPKQKISPNQMKQNIAKLKEIVKQVFDGVTDNASSNDISQNMIAYLECISCEYAYLLDLQHLRFEMNRLNFTYHGSLVNMNQNKQFMMIIASILIKVLLYRLLSKLHITIQGVKVTDQLKTNVKTLTSVVYEAIMLFLRGYTATQPDNTKWLPVESQVIPKKEICYMIDTFTATEDENAKLEEAKKENYDEPLLHPIYTNREMAEFFDSERLFVNTLQAMVEGWCEKVNGLVLAYRQELNNKRRDEYKQRKDQQNKILAIKRDQINKFLKKRKEEYIAISTDIKNLEDKIVQSVENNLRVQAEYEQMQQARNQRFQK